MMQSKRDDFDSFVWAIGSIQGLIFTCNRLPHSGHLRLPTM